MIHSIIEFSIRRRWIVVGCAVVAAIAGAWAAADAPIDAIPDLSDDQVLVYGEWPGHSPNEIHSAVTAPVAGALGGVAGVRTVRASSDPGFALITLILTDRGVVDRVRNQVRERLRRVTSALPKDAVVRLGPASPATGQIFWYTIEADGFDLARLRQLQDTIVAPGLSAVPGVAEVASVGGHLGELVIELDPLEAATHRILPGDIDTALKTFALPDMTAASDSGVVKALESYPVGSDAGATSLGNVARVGLGPALRNGLLEKDGSEAVGGVVLMQYGVNPVSLTKRLRAKIYDLQQQLPEQARIVPCYDRTPLIHGALHTVSATLSEAVATATVCIFLVMAHFRSSLVIAICLPLSVLSALASLAALRWMGLASGEINIMSLAGIAVSIGVLVDSSIVMVENVMHRLNRDFGGHPIHGDTRATVLPACRLVGKPGFFAIVVMLVSFLPVFALTGIEGRMFRPLAITKSLALLSSAVLAITVVPALCSLLIKGRIRSEQESWLVRKVIEVYRPVLLYLLDQPLPLLWLLSATVLVGFSLFGNPQLARAAAGAVLLTVPLLATRGWARVATFVSLLSVALGANLIPPIDYQFMTPLDEGMQMDMPISIPRISISQAGDDLKARDMVLCRFPEVAMVVGKAGRAETASDPAPLDMIETMVELRPAPAWPQRKIRTGDALRWTEGILKRLIAAGVVEPIQGSDAATTLVNEATMAALPRYDAYMREYCFQQNDAFLDRLGHDLVEAGAAYVLRQLDAKDRGGTDIRLAAARVTKDVSDLIVRQFRGPVELFDCDRLWRHIASRLPAARGAPTGGRDIALLREKLLDEQRRLWRRHIRSLNASLIETAASAYARVALEELLERGSIARFEAREAWRQVKSYRQHSAGARPRGHQHGDSHHHQISEPLPVMVDHDPILDALQAACADELARHLILWPKDKKDLVGFGGELDQAVQMPGWTNVWTMPIQNRVDMLATGVNTDVGIRVLGSRFDQVVETSERIAQLLRTVPGAVDVVCDPVRGKTQIEFTANAEKLARAGVTEASFARIEAMCKSGWLIQNLEVGSWRMPLRLRYPRAYLADPESLADLPIMTIKGEAQAAPGGDPLESETPGRIVRLGELATIRRAEIAATIKSENGQLRNYVRCNVRGRNAGEMVAIAKRLMQQKLVLPPGVRLEWTGNWQHAERVTRCMYWLLPLVLAVIFVILWFTFHDVVDAMLVMLAVPGALAGGAIFQRLMGYPFSVTVWVGYIACFGMATATGVVMLVYLRDAIENCGGLSGLSLDQLRETVLAGAVHRLRPKLLTEATTVLGLAPLLWTSGVGAEVIRPMAAPVLGGVLIADEVIDLLLPVAFYHVRRRRWRKSQLARGETSDRACRTSAPDGPRSELEAPAILGMGN